MKRFSTPLYWRVLVLFCVANLLVLVLGGLLVRRYIAYSTAAEIDWSGLANAADAAYETGGPDALAAWAAAQRRRGVDAFLFEDGRPLNSMRLPPRLRAQVPRWLDSDADVVRQPRAGLFVALRQVTGADGQARQLLAMSHSRRRWRGHARERILLAVQLSLSLLFIGLVGWWVARSVAQPVEALRRATLRMAKGELSVRVGRQGALAHDELAKLAGDFDLMAERLEALVGHDRAVLQDLSHELRSPLARLHLILDLARRSQDSGEAAPYFAETEQEIIRLDEMLGEMLELSRMEGGLPGGQREPVALAGVVRACLERARLEADARGIELRLAVADPVEASGSNALVQRALDNVLANAIKFSPPGGVIEVALHAAPAFAEVTVRDHGPGVPAAELAQLFRPFFRGSNARRAEGHGLGLSIVQRVAQAHGGQVQARDAQGGGLEVRLRLPRA
ncbi:MAG TPA: HAMP domain-containing sensor histidine kinase [Rhodanobacteraceae bacterium]|nr:HAMP domain-containing sensor histidine kinase [Rhodanobacteraceae bacterium]